jgi:hypothetical protein
VTGRRKRGPASPPPTPTPPGTTQVLKPWIVRDPDIVVQTREDANIKKQLAAQLPDPVLAKVAEYLGRNPKPSNNKIAMWVKGDPKLAPLVAHLNQASLAKKIGKLRE